MKYFMLLSLTLALSGCATMKKDQASIDAIKKVAVIAFQVDMPASAEKGMGLGSGSIIPESSEYAAQMHAELQKTLKANMNWTVVDAKAMTAKPGYAAAYKKTMTGWQNKMPQGEEINRLLVKDVMDWDSARILGQAGRDQLAKELGVDGVVAAWVHVSLAGTKVMGFGSRKPQSSVSFYVYRNGIDNPVWFESLQGKEANESVGATGFIDEVLMSRLAVESAKDAYSKIGRQ